MGYPYERFLRFLVSRKIDHDQALSRYGLPPAGGLWFARTKSDLIDNGPYPISTYLSSKSTELSFRDGILEWAEEEGFRELWEMQPEFGEIRNPVLSAAFQIFINPSSRPVAGMLLLTHASMDDVCETLQEYLRSPVTSEVVLLYQRIFWDVDSTTDDEWDELIEDLTDDNEKHLLSLALQGQTIDLARSALELDTEVNAEAILQKMLSHNAVMWEEARRYGDEDRTRSWQESALRVMKELREARKSHSPTDGMPAAGDFAGLFSVQVSEIVHPTLAELQGEIAPRAEANVEEEDG